VQAEDASPQPAEDTNAQPAAAQEEAEEEIEETVVA
jgi:hypothetical protein